MLHNHIQEEVIAKLTSFSIVILIQQEKKPYHPYIRVDFKINIRPPTTPLSQIVPSNLFQISTYCFIILDKPKKSSKKAKL